MVNSLPELIVNAMFYVYFVVLAGGLGLVTAGLIGIRFYNRQKTKLQNKQNKKIPNKGRGI